MSTGEQVHPGPPNGLELSCPAAQATLPPLYGNSTGNTSSNFPHASRVSCSELLGGRHVFSDRSRLELPPTSLVAPRR